MKQTLQLRLGQHLTMTPQLQQAIRLLQLSSLELQNEIQEVLDSNLMLEAADDADSEAGGGDEENRPNEQPEGSSEGSLELQSSDIPEDLPVDSAWEDIYDTPPPSSAPASGDADSREFEIAQNVTEDLRTHLAWQLNLTPLSEIDHMIAETIIDSINDDGFLTTTLEDIHQSLPDGLDIELDEIEAVLHRIQNFEPVGVGARDLRESLLIQLAQNGDDSLLKQRAQELMTHYFDFLGNRDYTQIMRRMKIPQEELKEILLLIQSLNPRPGSQISEANPEYIVPDVFVRKVKGRWRVELNLESSPRLRINAHYANLIKQANNSSDSTYLKNHLQEAKWFLKSLNSRNETLLKVASSIVEKQRAFLEYGEEAMKALVLHDIAEEVDMHESTISRVTTKKYMHTPRGIYELKYFFSSHVNTASGGECSATAIRALIKKLIAAENTQKPLSDSKIAEILSDQGINVARRTVAKYREAMAIPPSNERKRLT